MVLNLVPYSTFCRLNDQVSQTMRSTIAIDDDLLAKAKKLTQIDETSKVVREALKALVARESARRLARLGGTDPIAETAPRRRGDLGA